MAQDLSQSLYQDLYAQCGNDEAAARAMYQNFIHDKEAERRRTLQEAAQTFPSLPERVIVEILDSCQWSLELACAPLVAAVERIEEQDRYRREEERRQRYLRAQDLAIRNLHSALTPNNKEELRQLLEENEGDVEATVELFVQQVLAVRRVEEHDRELERKQRIINALMDSGLEGILRADVEAELQKCNWDFNLASVNLLRLSEQRKIAHLQRICGMAGASFPVERLERALNENSWNVGRAREALLREVAEQPASVPAVPDFMTRSIHIANEVKRVLESEQNGSERAMMDALADVIRTKPADIGLVRAPGLVVAPSIRKEAPPVVEEDVAKSALAGGDRPTVESQVLGTPAQPQTIALHLSDTRVDKSQTLQISWQVPDNYTVSNRDWIGLYTIADQAERSYLTYQWVVPGTPTVSFSMSKLAYGEYICRYFSATQKGCVGSSPSFSVGPLFALTPVLSNNETNQVVLKIEKKFGDNPSSRAWVGLYYIEPGQVVPNQNYITYQRLGSLDNGLIFDITKAGEWEFRLFPENTYVAAACCPITIAGEDLLTLTLKGTQIEIQVDLQTKDVATDAPWIGVYKVEEKNIRMYRRYKYLSANGKSTIVFKAPIHTGNYHARLLAGNSDTVLATSNSILIEGI